MKGINSLIGFLLGTFLAFRSRSSWFYLFFFSSFSLELFGLLLPAVGDRSRGAPETHHSSLFSRVQYFVEFVSGGWSVCLASWLLIRNVSRYQSNGKSSMDEFLAELLPEKWVCGPECLIILWFCLRFPFFFRWKARKNILCSVVGFSLFDLTHEERKLGCIVFCFLRRGGSLFLVGTSLPQNDGLALRLAFV